MKLGKSESGDSVSVDRDDGSVVGRVESVLITRVLLAPFGVPRGNLGRTVARNGMRTQEQVP